MAKPGQYRTTTSSVRRVQTQNTASDYLRVYLDSLISFLPCRLLDVKYVYITTVP